MKIESLFLVPQLGIAHESIQEISLSHIPQSCSSMDEHGKASVAAIDELENKQQLENERDKFAKVISNLNPLESAILRAHRYKDESGNSIDRDESS